MAYYQLEPWGTKVEDFRAASIMAIIANAIHGLKGTIVRLFAKKSIGRARYKPADFMPRYGDKPKMKWQQMLSIVKALNKAMGGKVIDKDTKGNTL